MSNFNWDENFKLNVARGKVRGATFTHRFGAVPEIAQAGTGSVWDVNTTLYPWSAFDTAGTLSIPAVNAADNGKVVIINGLDNNYTPISENVTVSNTSSVNTANSYKRVFGAYITSGASNVADITFTKGGTTVMRILAGTAQTLMAIYTIPAGKTGYLFKGACSGQTAADGTGDMMVRLFGQDAFRIGHAFEVGGGGLYSYEFSFPLQIPEKTDIDVRVTTRVNKGRYTAAYDILLLE